MASPSVNQSLLKWNINVRSYTVYWCTEDSSILFSSQEMQAHIDKINEMASVMRKAIEVDEGRVCEDEERIKQLEVRVTV